MVIWEILEDISDFPDFNGSNGNSNPDMLLARTPNQGKNMNNRVSRKSFCLLVVSILALLIMVPDSLAQSGKKRSPRPPHLMARVKSKPAPLLTSTRPPKEPSAAKSSPSGSTKKISTYVSKPEATASEDEAPTTRPVQAEDPETEAVDLGAPEEILDDDTADDYFDELTPSLPYRNDRKHYEPPAYEAEGDAEESDSGYSEDESDSGCDGSCGGGEGCGLYCGDYCGFDWNSCLGHLGLVFHQLKENIAFHLCAFGCQGGSIGGEVACDADGTVGACDQGKFIFQYENTFLRYHHTNGIEHGSGDDTDQEFDFESSPRVTVGLVGPDGLGIRARWWDYDHKNHGASVDTENIDIEFYEELCLTCYTSIEFSVGIRIHDYEERGLARRYEGESYFDGDVFDYDSVGGILGIELNRQLAVGGALYARLREAILMDDFDDGMIGAIRHDTTQTHTEIGFGYEKTGCMGCAIVTVRAGAEWQNWQNYGFSGREAVGFGGFVIGTSIAY